VNNSFTRSFTSRVYVLLHVCVFYVTLVFNLLNFLYVLLPVA